MNTKEYQEIIEKRVYEEFEIAKQARAKGFDFSTSPEIYIAKDIADKVEGLVEIKGIAAVIRQLQKQYKSDEEVAFKLADVIIEKTQAETNDRELAAEFALRAALAYLTQGAVSAPIEGIAKVKIKHNPDDSEYLSVYYAGPIRAAGGTAEALSIIVADYVRKSLGLGVYKPTAQEIGRYAEEILWYKRNVRLQYMPSKEEIETIVRHVPVCIDGEPTEEFEVITYRDLGRVETNRVRGGMCLVVAEGIAQKAAKLVKKLKPLEQKYGLDWSWLDGLLIKRAAKEVPYAHERLEALIESAPAEEYSWLQNLEIEDVSDLGKFVDVTKEAEEIIEEIIEEKPAEEAGGSEKYIQEIPAGRPVFSHPSRKGGFNLRYGRTRATGYSAIAVNPATMHILGGFIAIGTQLRMQLPGKAGIVTPCETIDGPTVVLEDGEVLQVNTVEDAKALRPFVKQIINVGDMLIAAGDFIENNHKLLPPAYTEEYWSQEVKKTISDRGLKETKFNTYLEKQFPTPSFEVALEISKTFSVPMHPRYTFRWHDITQSQLAKLVDFLNEKNFPTNFELTQSSELKEIFETLLVFHKVKNKKFIVNEDHAKALLASLSLNERPAEQVLALIKESKNNDVVQTLNRISPFIIKKRSPSYIGARMGRPEKAKPRKMVPPPHTIFPTGLAKGRIRDLIKAANAVVTSKVEVSKFKCEKCKTKAIFPYCHKCGSRTTLVSFCQNCGRETNKPKCPNCSIETKTYERTEINLKELVDSAFKNIGASKLNKLGGVLGMTSKDKVPEPIEKGILRATNNIYVFKDGTVRFDATNAPLSHFRPREISVSVEKLKQFGYTTDANGGELKNSDQILELKPQDIIISDNDTESCADYLISAANFVDDLLEKFYKLPRFYNIKKKEELLGKLVIGLAPHTSTGTIGRIMGFTKARVCFANPAFHDAKRRDCDGDEDSVMLLLDAFINFSKCFVPEKRGGRMDAPLVISTNLNPLEIDDEVYDVDIVPYYPLDFYSLAEQSADSGKVQIKTFGDIVNSSDPFNGWSYTHEVIDINSGVLSNIYTEGEMLDKLRKQLELAEKIKAVDAKNVVERIIDTHFIPDIKGNLRTFLRQRIRCTKCNSKYRRPPLRGNCPRCNGNLTLTVHPGTIKKYLEVSKHLVIKYKTSLYLKQQIDLLDQSITSIFGKEKQQTLAKW